MTTQPLPPAERLAASIRSLDNMAVFFLHWTTEAHCRLSAGDTAGALAALAGADRLLLEMAEVYREICR